MKDYVKWAEKLKKDRAQWETHWQELAYYCLPMKGNITSTDIPGSLLPDDIYDSTAIESAQLFGAALYAYLTNPSARWFSLGFGNPVQEEKYKKWLREQEDIIYDVLANSNFYQPIFEVYVDFIVFGTANMYAEEDPSDYVRFHCRPLSESCISENERGIVDTNVRFFKLTARQAYEKWGEKVSEEIKEKIKAGETEEKFEFIHIVRPRYERDPGKSDSENLPWESIYIERKSKKIISIGGYYEFPFFVPRNIKRSDSPYGYSTSMVALPDIKMANSMALTVLTAEEKMVDPPLQGPDDGYVLPLDTSPGAINYHRPDISASSGFRPLYDTRIHNLDAAMLELEYRRKRIERAFYTDLFLILVNRPKMTATEVIQRVDEKMLILSPMLGRLMKELLNPVIHRTFSILVRSGVIEVPEELQGVEYSIRYVSPLAKAQKAAEVRSITNYLDTVAQMAQLKPDLLDKVNLEAAVEEIAWLEDIPPKLLRDDQEVESLREQREQQQAEAILLNEALRTNKEAGANQG